VTRTDPIPDSASCARGLASQDDTGERSNVFDVGVWRAGAAGAASVVVSSMFVAGDNAGLTVRTKAGKAEIETVVGAQLGEGKAQPLRETESNSSKAGGRLFAAERSMDGMNSPNACDSSGSPASTQTLESTKSHSDLAESHRRRRSRNRHLKRACAARQNDWMETMHLERCSRSLRACAQLSAARIILTALIARRFLHRARNRNLRQAI